VLDLWNLKKLCKDAKLLRLKKSAQLGGYHSQLVVTVPTPAFLLQLKNAVGGLKSSVFYVEVACDKIQPTQAASIEQFNTLMEHARMKNSNKVYIYDADRTDISPKRHNTGDLFGDKTFYLGNDERKFVAYPRNSKITGNPCLHSEWRLERASTIRQNLGVNSIFDLFCSKARQWYRNLTGRFITYEEIDHEEHGRFIQDMPHGAVNPGIMPSGHFTGGPLAEPERASHLLMRARKLATTSELRAHYAGEKKRIKEKLKGKQNLTEWETRVHRLGWHKLNKFFKVCK
jgi:hypothetical protein